MSVAINGNNNCNYIHTMTLACVPGMMGGEGWQNMKTSISDSSSISCGSRNSLRGGGGRGERGRREQQYNNINYNNHNGVNNNHNYKLDSVGSSRNKLSCRHQPTYSHYHYHHHYHQ